MIDTGVSPSLSPTHGHIGTEIVRTRAEAVDVAKYAKKTITEWKDLACLTRLSGIISSSRLA
jgi:hypothetical protein